MLVIGYDTIAPALELHEEGPVGRSFLFSFSPDFTRAFGAFVMQSRAREVIELMERDYVAAVQASGHIMPDEYWPVFAEWREKLGIERVGIPF